MSGEDRSSGARPARRQRLFSIVTIGLGVIAIALLAWRISKAWRLEYGGAPREPIPIPTGGSFGPPGGPAAPTTSGALPATSSAAPGTTAP